ncbi:serine/threonine-protein kinase ZRK1-like [Quercus suber]|uniref:serine/threonine-protein kinase ZRK1-like n=1 Tax=Quercus suber TaxID=58331 RepID=UPI0032DE4FF5
MADEVHMEAKKEEKFRPRRLGPKRRPVTLHYQSIKSQILPVNGSKLLEKLVVSCNGKPISIRTFSAQELCLATNNYNNRCCFFGYKGSLEGQIVLIRKFHESKSWFHFAINDIVIYAQMSAHSNVLKFVGCCLQTPCLNMNLLPMVFLWIKFMSHVVLNYNISPWCGEQVKNCMVDCSCNFLSPYGLPKTRHPYLYLIYIIQLIHDFASYSDRIYVSSVTILQYQPMPWEKRLKIARQIAHVISYLHTAFHRPVIHMTIDMYLLDEHDVPKLSNFLISVSIPKAKLTWKLMRAFGIQAYPAQGSCINEIVDPAITADGKESASLQRQLQAVLYLVLICTKEDPQRRPSMVDVTKELGQIERFAQADEELLGSLRI